MTSVRLHIRRCGDGVDCVAEAIPQNARHIEIEAQPSGNHGLCFKVSVISDTLRAVRQNKLEQASEVSDVFDRVDDADRRKAIVSQRDRFPHGSFSSVTQQNLLTIDRVGTVTRHAPPAKQERAA